LTWTSLKPFDRLDARDTITTNAKWKHLNSEVSPSVAGDVAKNYLLSVPGVEVEVGKLAVADLSVGGIVSWDHSIREDVGVQESKVEVWCNSDREGVLIVASSKVIDNGELAVLCIGGKSKGNMDWLLDLTS
jgi:hypothetical protein